jgi:hypothetical protein
MEKYIYMPCFRAIIESAGAGSLEWLEIYKSEKFQFKIWF